jgi:polysaccharide biosynthesis/export protein
VKRALCLLVVMMASAACTPEPPNYPYKDEPDPRAKELTLGVGDVVGINVWENTNLNTESTIRPDGTITMPLVGDVKAVGETPSSLREKIKTQLAQFLKLNGTEVTVAVRQWHSYRFRIDGEVQRPGIYSSDQYLTVADAIALACGPTRFAKRGEIRLLRTDAKSHTIHPIPLDYDLLTGGTRTDMNIYVLPGDAINIP